MSRQRDWRTEPLTALRLSGEVRERLERSGVTTVGQLCDLTDVDLMGLFWSETLAGEVRAALAEHGLSLRPAE